MLRLLKEEAFRSRSALSEVLGYSERQMDRWFQAYGEKGLDGLLDRGDPGGSAERVTPEAWKGLCKQMTEGKTPRFEDARRYLAEEHEIHYAGITSISMLFQRRGVKLKTGRKQDRKADPDAQDASENKKWPHCRNGGDQ
jgi:transposase